MSATALASAVAVLAVPPLRRRVTHTLTEAFAKTFARARERARLRVAAALLDLGNHLMLCDEERCARRLQRLIGRTMRKGRQPEDVLRRFGGARTDEVTFEAIIGSRPQEGNPTRTLRLSCTVSRLPADALGPRDREPAVAWRVTNRPSEGHTGPISFTQVPDLERALISYHASALLSPAAGGRFFDEGVHEHSAA